LKEWAFVERIPEGKKGVLFKYVDLFLICVGLWGDGRRRGGKD
jgi:hypothetical protein